MAGRLAAQRVWRYETRQLSLSKFRRPLHCVSGTRSNTGNNPLSLAQKRIRVRVFDRHQRERQQQHLLQPHLSLLIGLRRRDLFTWAASIPTVLIPPAIFLGLLLSLWTWKCFWIVILQDKLLYLSWLPPLSRSEKIEDYAREFRGVQWSEIFITSSDGTKLAVCEGRLPAPVRRDRSVQGNKKKKVRVVICYFQGNGGSTPLRLPLLSLVMKSIEESSSSSSSHATGRDDFEFEYEYIIAALSYRGYWKSSGRATQRGIEGDAAAFLNWVYDAYRSEHDDLRVVLWGHSLGAAVASSALVSRVTATNTSGSPSTTDTSMDTKPETRLTGAKEEKIAGLILEAPISSIKDMLVALYPQKWLPYRYLHPFSWNHWDVALNLEHLAQHQHRYQKNQCQESIPGNGSWSRRVPPILLLSAENDEVIPLWVADQLEHRGRDLGLEIVRVNVKGAMHIEAPLKGDGRTALVGFIRRIVGDRS
ncbi:Alpha/Beta hydrolase protein [Aspergillus spinulosporus]